MKYRLTEKIGSGGMAEVFRAVGEGPEGFERPFVIKRIHPRLAEAPDFVRMFVDEATISARLIHPNIVQVFEFAHRDGGYYLVMEPVDGMDMAQLLRRLERRREVPPPAFVAEVGRQACRGLEFAHTLTGADGTPLGIVHRDVTPPNIMVAWNGAVKIVDFGIARAVQELRTNLSDKGMVKGKMSYIAPELLDGHPADSRCDIFSLGIVLHELLCGQRLFVGGNDLETLKKVQEMAIEAPSKRNPGVKPALDRVVMRALARDPEKRFQTAREMGDELEAVVVRERYSTRVFAKKARELLPEPEQPAEPAAGGFGQKEVEIAAGPGEPPRRPAPPPVPRPAAAAAAEPARTATPARSRPPRWVWAAVGAPAAVALALLLVLILRPAPAPLPAARAATAPAPSPSPSSSLSQPPLAHVALDSVPQGAAVTSAPAQGSDGKRFGETPVLLELPRGSQAVELLLTKAGFAPVTFRIIPNQDKDVVAPLERLSAPVVAHAGGGSPRPVGHAMSRRTAAAAPSAAPTPIAAARPAATPAAPARPTPAAARSPAAPTPAASHPAPARR
jgi:serine/threonine-protein kinase